jgi:hypothetical protein
MKLESYLSKHGIYSEERKDGQAGDEKILNAKMAFELVDILISLLPEMVRDCLGLGWI